MKLRNKNTNLATPGFTLIEMVVSISIIVMISSLFIANYQTTNKRTDLIMAAQKLVADIHLAQNNTLGLYKYNGEVPLGGWGVHFDLSQPTEYIVFADLDGPGDLGFSKMAVGSEDNVNYGARIGELAQGLEIQSLTINGIAANVANVSFLPPDPQTNIIDEDSNATGTELTIVFKEARNNSLKTIKVNFLGLAEVID